MGISLTENPAEFKKMVAYIPETPILYPELTLKEHLGVSDATYGLDPCRSSMDTSKRIFCKMFLVWKIN